MRFWFDVNYKDIREEVLDRLTSLKSFRVPLAGLAILRLLVGEGPIDDKNLLSARLQLRSLGLQTSDTLAGNENHPVWQQGDFLIPILIGFHPCIGLQFIQNTLVDMGFSSQEQYIDHIIKNELDNVITPFSHVRNNAVYTLAFLRNEKIITNKNFDDYSDYMFSIMSQDIGQDLENYLDDANERIRAVLFSSMTFEEADTLLLS
jgi:hypothetical protein